MRLTISSADWHLSIIVGALIARLAIRICRIPAAARAMPNQTFEPRPPPVERQIAPLELQIAFVRQVAASEFQLAVHQERLFCTVLVGGTRACNCSLLGNRHCPC